MKNILHIISSPKGDQSYSVQLGNATIRYLLSIYPGSTVTERWLIADEIPALNDAQIRSFFVPHNGDGRDPNWYSDMILAEVKQADIIVVGAPMYNFGIHALLKAYIDQLVRPGHSFVYEADGTRKGVLTNKMAYLCIASGGKYGEHFNPVEKYIVNYLQAILNYVGINPVIPLVVEGTVDPAFAVDYDAIVLDNHQVLI